jgi:thiol-disulfide isomerase/thioredoxin
MKTILYLLVTSFILFSCNSGGGDKGSVTKASHEKSSKISTGINIGERAPELVFKSPAGEKISLTSLRGKMVLIDFWAAWCPPCRAENPNLVKTYQHYKDKAFQNGNGFTVYGVSLDRKMEDWTTAIKKDGLEWESHVSDLKGWKSAPAAIYGIEQVPSNFLIDGNGIILAKDLRGQSLDDKLNQLLK